jgi:hypothetical protein
MCKILCLVALLFAAPALAVASTITAGPSPTAINPADYGVTFNGSDDAAAWQAAVNAAIAQNLAVASPCGTSSIGSPIVIGGALEFSGGGLDCTTLKPTAAGQAAISVTTQAAVTLRDFSVSCAAAGQTGISISPTGAANSGSSISRVRVTQCGIGYAMMNAASWVLRDFFFNAPSGVISVGVAIANKDNVDVGDSVLSGATISGLIPAVPGAVAIEQYSSGGLKISDSKIIGWYYGYLLNLAAGAATSDLLISNNSFEWVAHGAIAFNHQGSGSFSNVAITGNQIGLGGATSFCVQNGGGAGWLSNVGITGNRLQCATTIAMPSVTDLVSTGNF